ncbi:insulinase family protein [bacterium]|nr:insulinase family protein [bacterium]
MAFGTNGAQVAGVPAQNNPEINSFQVNPATNPLVKPNIPVQYKKISETKDPFGHTLHYYMLSNGQKVVIAPKAGTTIVKTFVNSGSMNETDDIRGISHFIEHSLFNGSSKIPAGTFFNEINKMGAETNASTNFAQTDYYISSALMSDEEFNKTVEMQADMINNPTFSPEMIEKEKGPVTQEISMTEDDSVNALYNSVIKQLFNIDTASKSLVAGSIETVSNLNRDDIVKYHAQNYQPENLTTVVVGDVEPDVAIHEIAKNFNIQREMPTEQRKVETLTPLSVPTRVDMVSNKDNYALSIAAFAGPTPDNVKDEMALNALSLVLLKSSRSRLSSKLRDLGADASFTIEKVGLKPTDPSAVVCLMQSPRDREQQVLDTFYSVVQDLKINPPTDEEMQIAKVALKKSLSLDFETSEGICEYIGQGMLNGTYNQISDYKNIIENLTANDIVSAANKYLDLNKVAIGVSHPQGTTNTDIMRNYNASIYAKNPVSFKGKLNSEKTFTTDSVHEYQLKDNTSLSISDSHTDMSYLKWKLSSYSAVPKNLSAHYVLAQILNDGSSQRTRGDIVHDSELKGVDYSFDANGISISADANCFAHDTADTINLFKEVIYSPNFTQESFDKAKRKIEDYLSTLPNSASNTLIAQLYPEYFATSKSILDGLKTLTLDDVRAHWQNLITNASSTFTVSAPISKNENLENEIINAVHTPDFNFKVRQNNLVDIYKPTQESKVYLATEERNQAEVFKTYSFEMTGNIEDDVKFELLNTILGGGPASRLFSDLRENKQLAYQVASEVQSFGNTGILSMFIKTTTDNKAQNEIHYDNLQKSLQGFDEHVQKLLTAEVSEEELACAKKTLKQNLVSEMELLASKTELLAMNADLPYGIKRIDAYFEAIDKITARDVKVAAQHIFSNKPVYSILTSPDTANNQMQYLQTLGQII